jgi:hypothetical protein
MLARIVGVPGPSSIPGSFLKGFDLATGEGKVSAALPGSHNLCNDMTIAADGSLYVTNSRAPQILRLKADRKELEVWLEDKQFDPAKDGVGLDGIAIGDDGNIYLNTFTKGEFFRVEMREGRPGKVTRLATSRPLTLPDGLRPLNHRTFLMAEGGGTLDRVSIAGDKVTIETLRDRLAEPTAVAKVGKDGNRRLRAAMVELAWMWLRWQPDSALSNWFRARLGQPGSRIKKIMIVALARKLLVALWRYVKDGVIPVGAKMKTA